MRVCTYCKKTYQNGGTRKLLRGHYNPTAYSKKRANLQWSKDPKTGERVIACTACIRTFSKTKKK